MRRTALQVAALGASLIAVLVAAPAASAANDPIVAVNSTTQGLQVVLTGPDLNPNSVRGRINGATVPSHVRVTTQDPASAPRVMLVLDTSDTMAGAPLAEAQQAAQAFLATVPPATAVGLATSAGLPQVLAQPATDRTALSRALASVQAGGETSLFDAVDAAISALGPVGDRHILVLAAGGDATSRLPMEAVTDRLATTHVHLDAVALTVHQTQPGSLQALASAGAGQVITVAQPKALSGSFRAVASALSTALVVTLDVPAKLAGHSVTVAVSVASHGRVIQAQRPIDLPPATGIQPTAPGSSHSKWLLWLPLAALAGGLLVLLVFLLGPLSQTNHERRLMRGVISRYAHFRHAATSATSPAAAGSATRLASSQAAQTALDWAGRVAAKQGVEERLALRLDRAGLRFTAPEWVLLQVGTTVAGLLLGFALSRQPLITVAVGIAGGVAPTVFLRVKANRRQNAFQDQLADSLRLTASSLLAGYSFNQALDALVRDGTEPMASEIGRALAAARLGVNLEDALDEVAARMDSVDMRWTVMAVRVQREVGGNLAEVLDTVAGTIRERGYLRRQVRTLSAEGRLSAYVLIGMPMAIAAYTITFRREYEQLLWTTLPGVIMSIGAVIMMVVGWLSMRKLIKVEV